MGWSWDWGKHPKHTPKTRTYAENMQHTYIPSRTSTCCSDGSSCMTNKAAGGYSKPPPPCWSPSQSLRSMPAASEANVTPPPDPAPLPPPLLLPPLLTPSSPIQTTSPSLRPSSSERVRISFPLLGLGLVTLTLYMGLSRQDGRCEPPPAVPSSWLHSPLATAPRPLSLRAKSR